MKRTLALCITLLVALTGTLRAEEPAVNERIAVVRIKDVIQKYQRYREFDSLLKRRFKVSILKMENEAKALLERAERYRDNLKTAEDLEAMIELERQQFDLMQRQKAFQEKLNALQLKMVRILFEEIRKEIEVQAKKKNAAHVLSVLTLSQVEEEASSLEELVLTYRSTPVLYFDKGLDITDDVLSALNGRYKKDDDIYVKTKDLETLLTTEDFEAIKKKPAEDEIGDEEESDETEENAEKDKKTDAGDEAGADATDAPKPEKPAGSASN